MIDPLRYKPLLWSERLLSVLPGQPPYLGCGVSTAAHGLVMATAGEFSFLADGRLKGKSARTNDLKKGWRAFLKVADSNGIPDTDDYIRIHRAMAPPGTPDPEKLWTRRWSDITDAIRAGMFVSIAVRLSAVRGTRAARYTTADHQMGIWEPRLFWGNESKWLVANGKTKRIDPMHPHSYNTYHGDVIDLDDARKAAKAIEGGLILAWLYPIGGWTQAKLTTDKTIDRLRDRRDALTIQLGASREETQVAEAEVARLRALVEGGDQIANARAAGRESAFVQVLQHVQAMRTTEE